MKILVCCGHGIGSSFMLEINIKKVLQELGVEAEVDHADLSSVSGISADIYVGTRDIAEQINAAGGKVVSLNSMIDMQEIKTKIEEALR